MKKALLTAVSLLALSTPALAQVPVFSTSTVTYQPLTAGTAIPYSATCSSTTQPCFDSIDDSGAVVPLRFSFPYFGANYTSVLVDTNGFISFDTVTCTGGPPSYNSCLSGNTMPSTLNTTHLVVAPFWDDLHLGTGQARYVSTASDFTVEWSHIRTYTSTYITDMSMQVRLSASGQITVHYGPITGSNGSATAGFENVDGTQGRNFLAKAGMTCDSTTQTGCCSFATAACSAADWVPNTLVNIGEPLLTDLAPASVTLSNLTVLANNNLTFNLNSTIKNYGRTPASGFGWKAFLAPSRTARTDDAGTVLEMLVAQGGPLSIGASDGGFPAEVLISAPAASPSAPDAGAYYVLVQVDPANLITEASKSNNIGSTANYFVYGLDLVATGVSGPATTGGGNVENITVQYFNQGTQDAGVVDYRLLLSTDQLLDANDFVLYDGTRLVTGGETVNEAVPVPIPANAPNGDFYYLLQLDPNHRLNEALTTNNVAASSAKVSVRRANLVNEAIAFLDPLTNLPTTVGHFGEAARMTTRVSNQGGANAQNFRIGVVVSTDATLSLLSDTLVYELPVGALNAGTPAQTFTLDFTLPLNDRLMQPFGSGPYFVFVVVDSTGAVFESNKGDNNLVIGPLRLYAPGPDLIVSAVQAPASAGVGETIPVFRTLRNIGNVAAPAADYKFYASANNIITPDDIPLQIVRSGGALSDHGTVTLARGASDSATELVKLPGSMAAGTYYLGAIIDPAGLVAELDKTNNSLAGNTVVVAPSSLRVATTQLPDATIGRPYAFRLSALGEQPGASTWATADALPDGLTLGADGLLSGTPTALAASVMGFTATVTNAGRSATGRLVLRVLPESTQVEITTASLPPIVNSSSAAFTFSLGAAGGVKPYTWSIAAGTLPRGIALAADGTLSGAPSGSPDGQTRVTFAVRDVTGSRSQRDLLVRLVASGSIVFRTASLPDAVLGQDYLQDIAVQNLDPAVPLAKPLIWTEVGDLPDGISMTTESELITLSGRPIRAGAFAFTISVEDAKGRTDSMDYTIVVFPLRYKVTAPTLPALLHPGETATGGFVVNPAAQVSYRVVAGALPAGVALAEDGTLSGDVAADGTLGTWNFVVEAKDVAGGSGLGPFALRVEPAPKPVSCSSTGSLSPLGAAALGLLALRRRRARSPQPRRRALRLGALAAALTVLLPALALAQAYQVDGPNPTNYAALAGGTPVTPGYSGMTVPLAFPFTFYGQTYSSVTLTAYGLVVFAGGYATPTNLAIPTNDTFYAPTFLAPWWDDLSYSLGTFKYQVLDSAPQRKLVLEWGSVASSSSTGTRFSFQTILYESTNQIRFAYGPAAPGTASATVGIQASLTTGIAATLCGGSGTCGVGDWQGGKAIDFYLPPDLKISAVSADQIGYAGVAYHATATVQNIGGRSVTTPLGGTNAVVVRFYLSTDTALDPTDVAIGDGSAPTSNPFEDVLVTGTLTVPVGTAPGNYYIIPKVDPDNLIVEQNETNNVGTPVTMIVGPPTPDLLVTSMSGPGAAAPGAMVTLNRVLTNAGNAAAGAFKYTYFLSDNAVVSISDVALSPVGTVASLAQGASDTGMDTVALPTGIAPGQYWLGMCVNYDAATGAFGLTEISLVNNCFSSPTAIVISTGAVTITTPATLPGTTQYSPYGLRLQASGGNGSYAWEQTAGSLPPGLVLSAAGDLVGAPAAVGTFSFDVKVTSGTLNATASLSLSVAQSDLALVVVDQDLPAAEFGRAYSATLVAVGGKPPYRWSLKAGTALPDGLALAADGVIEGRAASSGDQGFTVICTDTANATSQKDLKVRVVNPTTLSIATRALQTGYVTHDFLQPLVAVGGRGPTYTWGVVRFQQLPQNPTEQPGQVLSQLPDDFGLTVDNGATASYLRGAPKQAGLYSLTLKVVDGANAEDMATVVLYVTYNEGLAITTLALPDAFVNQNYAVQLQTNAARDVAGLAFSLPCVKQALHPDEFVCAPSDPGQVLPPGLTLGADGNLIGIPTGPEGTYTFLVKATDAQNRQDLRGLSIRVLPDWSKVKQGCASGLEPSLAALVLSALFLRRRRSAR